MGDNFELGIRGHIKAINNKTGILYNDPNTIGSGALGIIIQTLSQIGGTVQVDTIKANGAFGQTETNITSAQYNQAEKSITFKATFLEDDFNGTVEDLELKSNSLGGLVMAQKTGLSIIKDSDSRLQIEWKIIITLC